MTTHPSPTATTVDAEKLVAIYLDDHRAGAAGGLALARRLVERYGDEPGYQSLREFAREVEEDVAVLDRLRDELDVDGGDIKRLAALAGERLGRLKPNGRLVSKSPLSRVEELEQMAAGVFAKRCLWTAVGVHRSAYEGVDPEALIERADGQLRLLADLHRRAVESAFADRLDSGAGVVDTRRDDSLRERFTSNGEGVMAGMSNLSDDDITRDGPTEDDDNLDAPGEHSKDTGDEATGPTEDDDNLDAPGEHSSDSGDEA